jgi:hypothetical protein
MQQFLLSLMITINLSSRQIPSSIDIFQNNIKILEPEVYETGKVSDRCVRYLAIKLIAVHALFVRNFIENSESLACAAMEHPKEIWLM